MVDAARQEWLSTLQVGSRVVVKTQIKSYDGVVERIDDNKIWGYIFNKPIQLRYS